ncbi:hypothetical protein [Zavarzinella formosa]|uniref:hypothetical protein n=1 Tax=Zavarzinella formosa TaxID=360055 RepID=UPI000317E96F|nr:hypothetical protein [Zavarzinella formosa]
MRISRRSVAAGFALLVFNSFSLAADIPKPPEPNGADTVASPKLHSGTVRITEEKPDGPLHKAVRNYAQYYAFKSVQPPYNGEPEEKKLGTFILDINSLLKDAESFCTLQNQPPATNLSQAQLEFAEQFTVDLAAAAKIVLDNATRPMERLNIVRMLASCSKMPGTKLIDPLLRVINDPNESDALKLYAFQGIKTFLEHGHPEDPTKHINYKDVAKLAQISDSLTKYIVQKRSYRDAKEQMVIEYVRREAVAATGRFKLGVVRENTRKPLSRPGYTLMRVLWDPEIAPPVTIQERIEAICGFCQMKIDDDLNIDVAAPFLQPSLVEYLRQANNDFTRMTKETSKSILPWKISAARLSYSFALWREAAKTVPKPRYPEYITSLANDVIATLAPIEKEGAGATTDSNSLAQWLPRNLPKAWSGGNQQPVLLYKDDPTSLLPIVPKTPVLKTPDPKNPMPPAKTPDPKNPAPPMKMPDPKNPMPPIKN